MSDKIVSIQNYKDAHTKEPKEEDLVQKIPPAKVNAVLEYLTFSGSEVNITLLKGEEAKARIEEACHVVDVLNPPTACGVAHSGSSPRWPAR